MFPSLSLIDLMSGGASSGVKLVLIFSFISEYLFHSSLIKENSSWLILPSSIAFETWLAIDTVEFILSQNSNFVALQFIFNRIK